MRAQKTLIVSLFLVCLALAAVPSGATGSPVTDEAALLGTNRGTHDWDLAISTLQRELEKLEGVYRLEPQLAEPCGEAQVQGKVVDPRYADFPPIYVACYKNFELSANTGARPDPHRRRSLSSRHYVRRSMQVDISPIILKYAQAYRLDPYLINAVIKVESNFNPYAQSYAGACGLMQLKPSTAYFMGVRDYWDPEQNIAAGTKYLRLMLNMFGTIEHALAAYNAGPGTISRGTYYPYEYVNLVKSAWNRKKR